MSIKPRHVALTIELRGRGWSWRNVCAHLAKVYGLRVTPGMLGLWVIRAEQFGFEAWDMEAA